MTRKTVIMNSVNIGTSF